MMKTNEQTKERFLQQLALNRTYKIEKPLDELEIILYNNAIEYDLDESEARAFVFNTVKRLLVNCINYIQEGKTNYSNESIKKIEEMSK